jgi:hypothetical protein
MQTGSGGAMVAARVEAASTMATATLLERYREYIAHGPQCADCMTGQHCETAVILHEAWRAARRTSRPQQGAP